VRLATTTDELWPRAAELDLVVVASPNRTHVPLATRALQSGLAVVVDKPMCATAPEAYELDDLARERGLLLSAFQNRRWDGDYLTVCRLIAEGALGTVHRFESRFERWRPQRKGGWKDSPDPAEMGGSLYDLGSHLVDQAIHLFGPALAVYAELDFRRDGAETDDDDFVAIEHEGGVRSHLWVSAACPSPGPRFRVLGSTGGYVKHGLDPQEDALRSGQRPGPGWGTEPEARWGRIEREGSAVPGAGEPVPTVPGDYPAFYARIAEALARDLPAPVIVPEVAATLEVLEAARVSAREQRTVRLD
jgi:predicted dehydrogenase